MSPEVLFLVSIESRTFDTSKQSARTLCGFMRALALLRDTTYLELLVELTFKFLIFRLMGMKNQFNFGLAGRPPPT